MNLNIESKFNFDDEVYLILEKELDGFKKWHILKEKVKINDIRIKVNLNNNYKMIYNLRQKSGKKYHTISSNIFLQKKKLKKNVILETVQAK